jgi:hypothetical protein
MWSDNYLNFPENTHIHQHLIVAWQGSVNVIFIKANNYNVLTTTVVNGLFEVASITLAVKNLLTCLIYLV